MAEIHFLFEKSPLGRKNIIGYWRNYGDTIFYWFYSIIIVWRLFYSFPLLKFYRKFINYFFSILFRKWQTGSKFKAT